MVAQAIQFQSDKNTNPNISKNTSSISYPSQTIVKAKLEMTEPGDHDEVEADNAANEIINGGKISRKISEGSSSSGVRVSTAMECQLSHMQGGGHSMPSGLQSMMENGFGRDFSQVRLHTDSKAAEMSSSINAKAFTLGNDIYFNRGQYSPNTTEGQRLVAHELTHVAQGKGLVSRKDFSDISFSPSVNNTSNAINYDSYLPTSCYDVSPRDKKTIIRIMNSIISDLNRWENWRNMKGWENPDVSGNIPDINPTIGKFNDLLTANINCSNSTGVIDIENSAIKEIISSYISDKHLNLLEEWMRYTGVTHEKTIQYFGLKKVEGKMTHKYQLYISIGGNLSAGLGAGGKAQTPIGEIALGCYPYVTTKLQKITISYENEFGMKWAQTYASSEVGVGAECAFSLSAPVELSSVLPAESMCSGSAMTEDWFGPKDFWGAKGNIGGGGEAGSGIGVSAELSGLALLSFRKNKILLFNTSGICDQAILGAKARIGAEASIGAQGDVGNTDLTPAPLKISEHKRDILTDKIPETVFIKSFYFETGSDNVYNDSFHDNNTHNIEEIVDAARHYVTIGRSSGNNGNIIIRLVGHASPLWKSATSEKASKDFNYKLAKSRAEKVQKEISLQLFDNTKDLNIASLTSGNLKYVCDIDNNNEQIDNISNYTTDSRGSEEALKETSDIRNNDYQYRRVDVYLIIERNIDTRVY